MMRGGNREMRRMMDKMGLDMNELPNVQEVTIKTDKKEIIISKPSVTEMKAKIILFSLLLQIAMRKGNWKFRSSLKRIFN